MHIAGMAEDGSRSQCHQHSTIWPGIRHRRERSRFWSTSIRKQIALSDST